MPGFLLGQPGQFHKRVPISGPSLKQQGLLIPTNSPCNIPILPVQKPLGAYRLVQDLRLINEAVVPLHPTSQPLYPAVSHPSRHLPFHCTRPEGCILYYSPCILNPISCSLLPGKTLTPMFLGNLPGQSYHKGFETAPTFSARPWWPTSRNASWRPVPCCSM